MDVPDTFALLPRNLSDVYFSIDELYNPLAVMCLGGPNFDPKTLENVALAAKGFSSEDMQLAQAEDCLKKFNRSSYSRFHDTSSNVTWSNAGENE